MISPDSATGILKLLRNHYFLILWLAQLLSQLADKILLILLIAIATSTDYKGYVIPVNTRESMILFASTLPAIFFGSFAGIYVDRHLKRQILIVCNVLRGLLVLVIPFLPKILALLLITTFLISTLTQLFAPAEQSAIPLIVPKTGLLPANALFTITMIGSAIIGFAIGSPLMNRMMSLVPQLSAYMREICVGGMYLLSGLALLALPKNEEITPRKEGSNFLVDLREGFNYVRGNHLISGAMIQLIVLYAVFAALLKLSFNLAEVITNDRADFGFLLAAAGVGLGLGASILGQFGDRFAHRPLPLIGFIGIALVLAMFAFVNNLWLGLALSTVLGFHSALIAVPMQTVIQQYSDENMIGKVYGLLNNAENIALSLPLALAAVALDTSTSFWGEVAGLQVVMVSSSAIVLLLGMWAWSRTHNALQKVL
jgi:MFS family permease